MEELIHFKNKINISPKEVNKNEVKIRSKNIGDKGIKVRWKKSKTIIGRKIIIDFILSYSVIGKRHKIKNDIIFK